MKTRLSAILGVASIVLAFSIITSCDLASLKITDNGSGSGEYGSLTVNVSEELDAGSRSLLRARNLYTWPDEAGSYSIEGSGPEGAAFSTTWSASETCSIDSLATGSWDLSVTSYNEESAPLMRGSSRVTITANVSSTATVYLSYIEGNGAVSFTVTWPSEADIVSGSVDLNGDTRELQIDAPLYSASYTFASVVAGTDYAFEIQLLTSAGQPAYGTSGTVHVTNGIETPVELDITEYVNPPTAPENLVLENSCFAVDLAWDNCSGETGYLIDRRPYGSQNWTTIGEVPENSTAFRDLNPESLSHYEYRVSAYNDTAETASASEEILTPDFSLDIVSTPVTLAYRNGYRILDDGRVMAYGTNRDGQLGFASDDIHPEGLVISGLSDIVSVKSSTNLYSSVLALDSRGTLWRWGYLNEGEEYIPSEQTAITRQILDMWVVGDNCFLALDADGNVWSWGYNSYGQLGDGTTVTKTEPSIIEGLPEIKTLAVGGRHVIALSTAGDLYAWGANTYGQLGLGDTDSRLTPVPVPGISGVRDVRSLPEMNTYVSFLIMDDGSVMAAGNNSNHCFGLPDNEYLSFTTIPGLSDIKDIQYNYDATLALDTSGNLFGSGANNYGTLLDLTEDIETFTQVMSAPSSIESITAAANKVYCIDESGNSYAWGSNTYGELMTGEAAICSIPVEVSTSPVFTQITSGAEHSLAIDSQGDLWSWGANSSGQLGTGDSVSRTAPVLIIDTEPGNPVIQAEAFENRSAALLDDGSIFVWGSSIAGYIPVQFSDPDLGGDATYISAGRYHFATLRSDGTVWTWGDNYYAQLGNGTEIDSNDKAVQVLDPANDGTFLAGVEQIACGDDFTVALLSDGRVVSWGYDDLGNGTSNERASVPVYVDNITSADAIFCRDELAFALVDDVLWKWGQIHGVGHSSPINFNDMYNFTLTGISKIVIGGEFYPVAIALLDDGTIRVRGDSDYGYFGDGVIEPDSSWHTPVGLSNIADIAVSERGCHALASNGTLWFWGLNDLGQAGDGTITSEELNSPQLLSW